MFTNTLGKLVLAVVSFQPAIFLLCSTPRARVVQFPVATWFRTLSPLNRMSGRTAGHLHRKWSVNTRSKSQP